jgi:hypothetical protein
MTMMLDAMVYVLSEKVSHMCIVTSDRTCSIASSPEAA